MDTLYLISVSILHDNTYALEIVNDLKRAKQIVETISNRNNDSFDSYTYYIQKFKKGIAYKTYTYLKEEGKWFVDAYAMDESKAWKKLRETMDL